MKEILHRLDEVSRRDFVCKVAKTFLGVSLLPIGGAAAALNAPGDLLRQTKARRVIYLFMEGGMSHLDTFDPKPDLKDIQGPVGVIDTNVAGIRVTENVPLLAKRMDKLAVIRSMSHTQGNHEPGQYQVRTGFEHQTGITHPALGAWVAKHSEKLNPRLPQYVRMGGLGGHPGAGFFDVRYAPLPVAKPEDGLSNSQRLSGLTPERFTRNLKLAEQLDASFRQRYDQRDLRAYNDFYKDAVEMMSSEDLDAFDLKKETQQTRDAYGVGKDNGFGSGVLLARRLVERGVNFVEVDLGGWDTHVKNHEAVATASVSLDRTVSTLLQDLESRGLLQDTLVVLATEFGRSPEIDDALGRGHHPLAFTCLMAGGGIRGGQVIGKSDEKGSRVTEEKVSVLDFHATIAHQLGLDTSRYEAPFVGGQRFSLIGKDTGEKGKPIAGLI